MRTFAEEPDSPWRGRIAAAWRSRENQRVAYWFLLPAFLHLLIFTVWPVAFSFFISLHKWSILTDFKWVGLGNYIRLKDDWFFWNALRNTALYTLGAVPLGLATALAVAVALNHKLRGVMWFRTIFYLPAVTSAVAVSIVWSWIYFPEHGLLNAALKFVGLPPVNFLGEPAWALPALVLISVWSGLGPRMLVFLAGLQGIPEPLYEAAELDGAKGGTKFRHITLPLLAPTVFFLTVTSIIGSFQVFTLVYMMTKGGPLRSTDVVVYHIYVNAFERFRMGYAAAQSYVLFAIIFAVTLVQFRLMRRGAEGMN